MEIFELHNLSNGIKIQLLIYNKFFRQENNLNANMWSQSVKNVLCISCANWYEPAHKKFLKIFF